jgi:hypothetical protein
MELPKPVRHSTHRCLCMTHFILSSLHGDLITIRSLTCLRYIPDQYVSKSIVHKTLPCVKKQCLKQPLTGKTPAQMHWTKTKPHKHTEPLSFTTHKRDSQVELQHSTENSKQGEEYALDTQHALQTWEMYTTFSLLNLKGFKKKRYFRL